MFFVYITLAIMCGVTVAYVVNAFENRRLDRKYARVWDAAAAEQVPTHRAPLLTSLSGDHMTVADCPAWNENKECFGTYCPRHDSTGYADAMAKHATDSFISHKSLGNRNYPKTSPSQRTFADYAAWTERDCPCVTCESD